MTTKPFPNLDNRSSQSWGKLGWDSLPKSLNIRSYPASVESTLAKPFFNNSWLPDNQFPWKVIIATPFAPDSLASRKQFSKSKLPYPCPLLLPTTHKQWMNMCPCALTGRQAYSPGIYSINPRPPCFKSSILILRPSLNRDFNQTSFLWYPAVFFPLILQKKPVFSTLCSFTSMMFMVRILFWV